MRPLLSSILPRGSRAWPGPRHDEATLRALLARAVEGTSIDVLAVEIGVSGNELRNLFARRLGVRPALLKLLRTDRGHIGSTVHLLRVHGMGWPEVCAVLARPYDHRNVNDLFTKMERWCHWHKVPVPGGAPRPEAS